MPLKSAITQKRHYIFVDKKPRLKSFSSQSRQLPYGDNEVNPIEKLFLQHVILINELFIFDSNRKFINLLTKLRRGASFRKF